MMLNNDRHKHPVCGGCGQMTHGMGDNIDSHVDAIKVRLIK